jgi:hypothetical protein
MQFDCKRNPMCYHHSETKRAGENAHSLLHDLRSRFIHDLLCRLVIANFSYVFIHMLAYFQR